MLACLPVILSSWQMLLLQWNLSNSPLSAQRRPGGSSLERDCLQASDFWKVCGSPEWGCGKKGGSVRVGVFHDLNL